MKKHSFQHSGYSWFGVAVEKKVSSKWKNLENDLNIMDDLLKKLKTQVHDYRILCTHYENIATFPESSKILHDIDYLTDKMRETSNLFLNTLQDSVHITHEGKKRKKSDAIS